MSRLILQVNKFFEYTYQFLNIMIFSITRAFLDNFLKVQNRMIIFLFGHLKRPKEKRSLNINYIIGLI